MKFQITFKNPDGIQDAVEEACWKSVDYLGLTSKEKERLLYSRVESTYKVMEQWFLDQEYVTIEIDTEANTTTVVKQ